MKDWAIAIGTVLAVVFVGAVLGALMADDIQPGRNIFWMDECVQHQAYDDCARDYDRMTGFDGGASSHDTR